MGLSCDNAPLTIARLGAKANTQFLGASLLSSKFNVSFNVDLEHAVSDPRTKMTPDLAGQVFVEAIINAARRQNRDDLYEVRNSTDIKDSDVKTIKMAEKLRGMMLGIMAEANMTVTELPADTIIITEMPFERKDRDGEAA